MVTVHFGTKSKAKSECNVVQRKELMKTVPLKVYRRRSLSAHGPACAVHVLIAILRLVIWTPVMYERVQVGV